MPDQDQLAALTNIALALVVHLGDQRAGRVEHRKIARRGFLLDAFRDAMGREHRDGVWWDLGDLFDEHCALGLEAFHHVFVVHDLVAHVDRRAVFHQRALHDFNCAHHAGTETARLGQYHFHAQSLTRSADERHSSDKSMRAKTARNRFPITPLGVLHYVDSNVLTQRLEHFCHNSLGIETGGRIHRGG